MSKKKQSKKKATRKKKTKQANSSSASMESLPSLQSMEGVLAGLGGMGRRKRSAVDEAQEIMYDAWEAPTRQRAAALAEKALTISADCADAYNLLAEEKAESLEDAIDLYRKGIEAGERALGKKAFKEDVGYFWGLLETRPYMRARAGLAQSLWEDGQREEAVAHYWELLRLNPNDNQGIRDLLMPCLIELDRDKDAEKLFRQFEEDGMAVWMYSRALLDFRKHGESANADMSLKAALDENKHVPSYLLGRKKMPRALPGHYSFGDDSEAVLYAHGNRAAWKATPGALEWLTAIAK
jgi:tetratricopeptide (TPR) repeat protein